MIVLLLVWISKNFFKCLHMFRQVFEPYYLLLKQKPRVFEARDSDGNPLQNLNETSGYVVALMHFFADKLNITFNLKVTRGFGVKLANGTWSGMVGDVNRKVS